MISASPDNECVSCLRVLLMPKGGNRFAVENLCRAARSLEYAGSGGVLSSSAQGVLKMTCRTLGIRALSCPWEDSGNPLALVGG